MAAATWARDWRPWKCTLSAMCSLLASASRRRRSTPSPIISNSRDGKSHASDVIARIRCSCPLIGIRFPTLRIFRTGNAGTRGGEKCTGSTPLYTTEVRQVRSIPLRTASRTCSLTQITRRDAAYTRRETRRHHSPERPPTWTEENASSPCTETTNGIFSSLLSSIAAWPHGSCPCA